LVLAAFALAAACGGSKPAPRTLTAANSLAVYRSYPDYQTVEVLELTPIDPAKPVEENLRLLMSRLSVLRFEGAEIEVPSVEREGERLTAHVNLAVEPGVAPEQSDWWRKFQGSTGGAATLDSIRRTLTQPGFTGEWPDRFVLYFNGVADAPLDHVDLAAFDRDAYGRIFLPSKGAPTSAPFQSLPSKGQVEARRITMRSGPPVRGPIFTWSEVARVPAVRAAKGARTRIVRLRLIARDATGNLVEERTRYWLDADPSGPDSMHFSVFRGDSRMQLEMGLLYAASDHPADWVEGAPGFREIQTKIFRESNPSQNQAPKPIG
jgi:hypothetical protein